MFHVQSRRTQSLIVAVITMISVLAFPTGGALAADVAIDCSIDDLQATIDAASSGDTLTIADGTTCVGNFSVIKPLTIQAESAIGATLDGGDVNAGPVLTVFTAGVVSLENLIITGGLNTTPNTGVGGGIFNAAATLTLTDTQLAGNTADLGAGIYNNGDLTIIGGEVTGNTASSAGGGVLSNGTAALSAATVVANTGGDGGGIYNTGDMTVSTVSLVSDNVSTNPAGGGGGLWNRGSLTVIESTISGNIAADAGGGIHNTAGGTLVLTSANITSNSAGAAGGILNNGAGGTGSTATITGSVVDGNAATAVAGLGGGGIYNFSFGTDIVKAAITVTGGTEVTDNTSANSGAGGIRNQDGSATIRNALVSGNSSAGQGGGIRTSGTMGITDSVIASNTTDSSGGGISVDGNSSLLTILRSRVDANVAASEGGGLAIGLSTNLNTVQSSITRNAADSGAGVSNAGNATFTNSTVSGNSATTQGGGFLSSSTLTINNTTVTNNSALLEGGGIRVIGLPTVSLTGTILDGNISTSGGDCSGPLSGAGFNLVGTTALPCVYTGDPSDAASSADPKLGALGFYSETTEHHPLLTGSEAIDAGGACGLSVDQIGAARPGGPACDIGAIEGESVAPPVTADQVLLVEPGGRWHIRVPGNDDYTFFYGDPGDIPLFGDWDGDGFDTPGAWRQGPGGGFAYMTNTLPPDGGSGVADFDFFFGNPGDEVFSGDWNGDNIDTLGINREGHIFLTDTNGSGGLPVPTNYDFFFGNPGDRAFGGDGDGNGKDAVFVYRDTTGFVYWTDQTPVGPLAVAPTSDEFFFGDPADSFVAGDWNADQVDTASIFRGGNTTVYWTNTNASGGAPAPTDGSYVWGTAGWTPVAGVPELP